MLLNIRVKRTFFPSKITHCKRQFLRYLKHRIKDRIKVRIKVRIKDHIKDRIKVHGRPF